MERQKHDKEDKKIIEIIIPSLIQSRGIIKKCGIIKRFNPATKYLHLILILVLTY